MAAEGTSERSLIPLYMTFVDNANKAHPQSKTMLELEQVKHLEERLLQVSYRIKLSIKPGDFGPSPS